MTRIIGPVDPAAGWAVDGVPTDDPFSSSPPLNVKRGSGGVKNSALEISPPSRGGDEGEGERPDELLARLIGDRRQAVPVSARLSPKRRKPASPKTAAAIPAPFARFEHFLRHGIQDEADIKTAFDLLEKFPALRPLVESFEKHYQARLDDPKWEGQAFEFKLNEPGSYCKPSVDRRNEMAGVIGLGRGASIFAFIHELTHAIPLVDLPPEMASLPYQTVEEMGASPAFEKIFFQLLNEAYQDESFSTLAEALLYREMQKSGIPSNLFHPAEVEWLAETLKIYEEEGPLGYLRSELYIGRNHRSSYNLNRILHLTLLAFFDPQILGDPSLKAYLLDQGVAIDGGSQTGAPPVGVLADPTFSDRIKWVEDLIQNPSAEKIAGLAARLGVADSKVTLNLATLIENIREFAELASGKKQKASASFIGRRQETMQQVALLSETRRQFEKYRSEFDSAWKTAGGDPEKVQWDDLEGLVHFYDMALRLSAWAEAEDEKQLLTLVDQIKQTLAARYEDSGKVAFAEAAVDLEEARIRKNPEALKAAFKKAISRSVLPHAKIDVYPRERKFKSAPVPPKFRFNFSLRLLARALRDPYVHSVVDVPSYMRQAAKRIAWMATYTWHGWYFNGLRDAELAGDPEAFYEFVHALVPFAPFDILHAMLTGSSEEEEDEPDKGGFEISGTIDDVALPQLQSAFGPASIHKSHPVFRVQPDHSAATPTEEDHWGEEKINPYYYADPSAGIRYHENLKRGLKGETLDLAPIENRETEEAEMGSFPVTLFRLDDSFGALPKAIPQYQARNNPAIPPAVLVYEGDRLAQLHVALTVAEQRAAKEGVKPPERFFSAFRENLLAEASFFMKPLAEEWMQELQKEYPDDGSLWIDARLAIRFVRFAESQGYGEKFGDTLARLLSVVRDVDATSTPLTPPALREVESLLTVAIQEQKLRSFKTVDEKENYLQSVYEEYRVACDLMRSGSTPKQLFMLVGSFSHDPALREETIRFIQLGIRYTASFGIHTGEFREGVVACIKTIHLANLMHKTKDDLLHELLEKALDSVGPKANASQMTMAQKIAMYRWFEGTVLSEEHLAILAHYPRAESLLLERTSRVLSEVGSGYLPTDMQGQLLGVGLRLQRYFANTHPEILDKENVEKLARVSGDEVYQFQLADLYPSRSTQLDLNQPVEKWSPAAVRRGVPDRAKAWGKIREAIPSTPPLEKGGEGGFSDRLSHVLQIFEAFILSELEISGHPTLEAKDIPNLAKKVMERKREIDAGAHVSTKAALEAYTQALKIMTLQEKVLLTGLVEIPPIAFALELAEQAFKEGRPLSEMEKALWEATLAAPTISDAKRKRELYLLVIRDERFPLELKRRAALNLAYAGQKADTLETIVESLRGEASNELNFYRMLAGYWERVGRMPDDFVLLLIDEAKNDHDSFWRDFDRIMAEEKMTLAVPREIELTALSFGSVAEKYLEELEKYLTAKNPQNLPLVFLDDIKRVVPVEAENRERLRAALNRVKTSRMARKEQMELVRLDLPPAFLRLPETLRFLVLSFIRHGSTERIGSLIKELRDLNRSLSDAEVFAFFFERTGLVKVGQFLSQLVGMIPADERAGFSRLLDRVPPSSFAEVKRTIEEELGYPLEAVFSEFDPTPVSSASMGDVFRARLISGEEVYVKVSPPSKRRQNREAIATLRQVADDFAQAVKLGRFSLGIDIPGMIRDFCRGMETQLNFRREVHHAGQLARHGHRTPLYVNALTTPNVLIMTPAPGTKLKGLHPGSREAKKAARALFKDFMEMVFARRAHHGDPHPANLFWDAAQDDLVWIDNGLLGSLSVEDRSKIAAFLISLKFPMVDARLNALKEMASLGANYDEDLLREGIAALPEGSVAGLIPAILESAGEARLYVEPKLLKVLSLMLTVIGTVTHLDPEYDYESDFAAALQNGHKREPVEWELPFDKNLLPPKTKAEKSPPAGKAREDRMALLKKLMGGEVIEADEKGKTVPSRVITSKILTEGASWFEQALLAGQNLVVSLDPTKERSYELSTARSLEGITFEWNPMWGIWNVYVPAKKAGIVLYESDGTPEDKEDSGGEGDPFLFATPSPGQSVEILSPVGGETTVEQIHFTSIPALVLSRVIANHPELSRLYSESLFLDFGEKLSHVKEDIDEMLKKGNTILGMHAPAMGIVDLPIVLDEGEDMDDYKSVVEQLAAHVKARFKEYPHILGVRFVVIHDKSYLELDERDKFVPRDKIRDAEEVQTIYSSHERTAGVKLLNGAEVPHFFALKPDETSRFNIGDEVVVSLPAFDDRAVVWNIKQWEARRYYYVASDFNAGWAAEDEISPVPPTEPDPDLIGGKDSLALELPDPRVPWSEKEPLPEAELPRLESRDYQVDHDVGAGFSRPQSDAIGGAKTAPLQDHPTVSLDEPIESNIGDAEEVQEWGAGTVEEDEEIPEGYEGTPDHFAHGDLDGYSSVMPMGVFGAGAFTMAARAPLMARALAR